VGQLQVVLANGGSSKLQGVLHVSNLASNLIFVVKITNLWLKVEIHWKNYIVQNQKGNVLLHAPREGNLYVLELNSEIALATVKNSLRFWHQRFSHVNAKTLLQMERKSRVDGISLNNDSELVYVNLVQLASKVERPSHMSELKLWGC